MHDRPQNPSVMHAFTLVLDRIPSDQLAASVGIVSVDANNEQRVVARAERTADSVVEAVLAARIELEHSGVTVLSVETA